jgi:nicotinamide-nucleotide amidase
MPESSLSEKLADWEKNLNEKMELAYLPSPKGIKLRLTYVGKQKNILENAVNEQVEKLKLIIPELIFGYGETSLENAVAELLISQGKTVATAESCTGGYIAHLLTSISGSSAFFKGSVVAYANSVKEDVLHVSKENITNYGAVSEAVVKEMALQAKKMMNTDFAIATSGIAGPDGGTADKPVGTVWIAVATDNEVIARLHNFFVLREINIMHAASAALNMLRIKLLENKQ